LYFKNIHPITELATEKKLKDTRFGHFIATSSEDQKSYVLLHMQSLDLGQMQQCSWTGTT
jgi:hypothetical protein